MISLKTKETLDSKAVPGVRFTVRTLNKIQRAKRDFGTMATAQRVAILRSEYGPLRALMAFEGEGKDIRLTRDDRTPEQVARMDSLNAEFDLLNESEVIPAVIRASLVSIEGLEIDGAPATVDSLLDNAGADYDAFIDEIYTACEKAAGLSATETKNSPSATTSSEPEPGSSPTTSNAAPAVV